MDPSLRYVVKACSHLSMRVVYLGTVEVMTLAVITWTSHLTTQGMLPRSFQGPFFLYIYLRNKGLDASNQVPRLLSFHRKVHSAYLPRLDTASALTAPVYLHTSNYLLKDIAMAPIQEYQARNPKP